ncbi:MAG: UDP-N-acetylglucosamine 2-epimerase (non-hydrolyzing), partial [Tissierellia bacterium]|nr:UDP-N-acetylglucosamine 2-epimerase (non-hydrolyzing) [Tissierellia bacterium]
MKILVVFGTRPEAIKMCPLVNELYKRKQLNTVVCVTGQHKEMLKQVMDAFGVVSDYDLEIMKTKQDLFDVTCSILSGLKSILEHERPDLVLVHGDTSTSFATALACFYLRIPIGHIEAGLRTNNLYSPYPEEFNRHAISILAEVNFSPTQNARYNLLNEGISEKSIHVTGNTVIDALKTTVRESFNHEILDWVGADRLILITAHRRENI